MFEYRLLTTQTAPPKPMGIEAREDGKFVREVCSFQDSDVTMAEAQIILGSVRTYFKKQNP